MLVEKYRGYEIVEEDSEYSVRFYLRSQRSYFTIYRTPDLEDAKSFIDTL